MLLCIIPTKSEACSVTSLPTLWIRVRRLEYNINVTIGGDVFSCCFSTLVIRDIFQACDRRGKLMDQYLRLLLLRVIPSLMSFSIQIAESVASIPKVAVLTRYSLAKLASSSIPL